MPDQPSQFLAQAIGDLERIISGAEQQGDRRLARFLQLLDIALAEARERQIEKPPQTWRE
jgi:hypothetical protein